MATAAPAATGSSVLEWHPSEATGMLAATARGVRGTCEVRDAGLPVPLTDEGPTVHEVDLDEALSRNQLACAITATATLDQVEAHSREICGYSEIDYERNKAAWLKDQPPVKLDPQATLPQLDQFEAEARCRGITHTTFRRITEAMNLNGSLREDLRQLLISSRPDATRRLCGASHPLLSDNLLHGFKARARRGRAPPRRRGLPPVSAPAGRARRRNQRQRA